MNAQRADPAARRAGFAPNLPQQEQGQEQEQQGQQTAPDSGILVPESPESTGDAVQSVRLSGYPDNLRLNGVYTVDGTYGQHPLYRKGKAALYFASELEGKRKKFMKWNAHAAFSEHAAAKGAGAAAKYAPDGKLPLGTLSWRVFRW